MSSPFALPSRPRSLSRSLSRSLHFHKMQGAGNDFVVLDLFDTRTHAEVAPHLPAWALALCERRFGVGADGLLTLERATEAASQARMRMWNPDGTEDMCGNGLRCVAALAHRLGSVESPKFSVQTLVGAREVEILAPDLVRAAMGCPTFVPLEIPFAGTQPQNYDLEIEGQSWRATTLSTGSTHTVIFSDQPVSEADFSHFSPQLEVHPLFPQRTSILWASPNGNNGFRVRIWERGVGETLACGTGASAVAVAAISQNWVRKTVEIESRGGVLEVEWSAPDGEISLTGPATHVFEGIWRGDSATSHS